MCRWDGSSVDSYTHTHTQPFYGPFSGTTRVSWTLWCKGRLTDADTLTTRLGATPSRLTSVHLHHPPIFLRAGCPSCRPTNSVKPLKVDSHKLKTTESCSSQAVRQFAQREAVQLPCSANRVRSKIRRTCVYQSKCDHCGMRHPTTSAVHQKQ